jgi:hypothetical protein
MQTVYDVDEQRILWAKGERCIDDDDCGDDLEDKDGGGYFECFATSLKAASMAAVGVAVALSAL